MSIFKEFNGLIGVDLVDIDQIKELIKILEGSKLNKLTLKDKDGSEIHLEKSAEQGVPVFTQAPAMQHMPPQQQQADKKVHVEPTTPQAASGEFITSPLVGTFYAATSPEDPPFVKVGDEVTEDTVVCIIEAMKVMNEVKAGKSGKLLEVCIGNSNPVEFGTKLFRIE